MANPWPVMGSADWWRLILAKEPDWWRRVFAVPFHKEKPNG